MNDIRKCLERIDCVLASSAVDAVSKEENARIDMRFFKGLIGDINEKNRVFTCYERQEFMVECIKSWVVGTIHYKCNIEIFFEEMGVIYSDNRSRRESSFRYTSMVDLVNQLINDYRFLPETSRGYTPKQ